MPASPSRVARWHAAHCDLHLQRYWTYKGGGRGAIETRRWSVMCACAAAARSASPSLPGLCLQFSQVQQRRRHDRRTLSIQQWGRNMLHWLLGLGRASVGGVCVQMVVVVRGLGWWCRSVHSHARLIHRPSNADSSSHTSTSLGSQAGPRRRTAAMIGLGSHRRM